MSSLSGFFFDGLSIGQEEYIPHVLWGELIPDRDPDYVLALEWLPPVPNRREIGCSHTQEDRKRLICIAMTIHGLFQFFFVKHFDSFLSERITVERFD